MSPLITPEQALGIGFIFTRVIGIFLSFPLLNTSMIPLNVRVLFVVAFSFYVATIMDINVSVANISVLEIFLNILKELLIGFLLGVLVNIFIAAFSYAAELISYFMGLTIANMFDPTFGQISVLDRLFILIFYLLFFITGVYQIFLSGVIASFELFPVYQLPLQIFLGISALAIGSASVIYFAVSVLDETGSSFIEVIKNVGR